MAPTRVNFGLVHNMRLDLSVFLMGSISSDNGYSERRGFQLTYLSGLNFEERDFFPCFLKLDQALSQSVDSLSPDKYKEKRVKFFIHIVSVDNPLPEKHEAKW